MARTVIGATVSVLAIGAAPAVASACELPATTKAFAQFGDTNDYFLANGGDFETPTWSLRGADRVDGNDPFNLAPGSKSLRLGEEDHATSPMMCVSKYTPHLRFVARALGDDPLEAVVLHWEDGRVVDYSRTTIDADDHDSWAPSRNVSLKTDAFIEGRTAQVTVSLYSDDDAWLVDNVMIDPYRR